VRRICCLSANCFVGGLLAISSNLSILSGQEIAASVSASPYWDSAGNYITPANSLSAKQFEAANWSETAQLRFATPSAEKIASSRTKLLDTRNTLITKLKDQPEGMVIAREMELESYDQACETPSLERLDFLILKARVTRNKQIQTFVDAVRLSLREFRAVCLMTLDPTAPGRFSSSIELLSNAMLMPPGTPVENYRELSKAYEFLAKSGLVNDLLPPLQERFSNANQRLDFTQHLVDRLLDREIKRPIKMDKNQKGMKITGKGDLNAKPSARFVPDSNKASVNIHVDGLVNAKLVAKKSPITIYANTVIRLIGDIPVHLDGLGIDVAAPCIAATSHSTLTGLCLQLRSRILSQLLNPLASKIVQKQLTKNDPKAAEDVRKQVITKVEEYRDELVVQVNTLIQGLLWQSFDARDIDANLRSHTTSSALTWTAEFVGPGQLGAPQPSPTYTPETEIAIQFHESTFNNTDVSVASRRINEAIFTEMIYDQLKFARSSEHDDPPSAKIPSSFTFAELEPLNLHFDDGLIRGQLRIKAFSNGLKKYAGTEQTVRFAYRPRITQDGFTLDREGAIECEGGDSETIQALSATMNDFFKPQFVSGKIHGALSKASLKVGSVTIENGWLSAFLVPQS
jgi:hypothetical protein